MPWESVIENWRTRFWPGIHIFLELCNLGLLGLVELLLPGVALVPQLDIPGIIPRKNCIGYQRQNAGLQKGNSILEEMRSVFADVYELEEKIPAAPPCRRRGNPPATPRSQNPGGWWARPG